MINCQVILSHRYLEEEELKGRTAVVIDTLRATSVMVTALAHGLRDIRCVLEPEEALMLKEGDSSLLLGGERNALRIPGFDLSNSPLEYTGDRVEGRSLIMTTSNGTRTLLKTAGASDVLIGSVLNAAAVAREAFSLGRDIIFINAGTGGEFSLDDFITAGAILNELPGEAALSDLAWAALLLRNAHPDLHSALKGSLHYRKLQDLGFQADLDWCLSPNRFDIAPRYRDGQVSVL